MKIQIKVQRKKIVGSLLIASFVLMVILAMVGFAFGLKDLVDRRTNYMIDDVVQQYAKSFTTAVNTKLTTVVTIADILGSIEKNDIEQLNSIIFKVAKGENFHLVNVSDIHGNTVASNIGNMNVSEQDYFQKVISGENVVSHTTKSLINDEGMLLFSVPIYSGTAITGVLSCGYEVSKMEKLIQNPDYFGEAYTMIYSGDYKTINSQKHKNALSDGSDLVQIFEKGKMFDGMSGEKLKHNMEKRMIGSFSMEYLGETRLVSYAPIGINDWYAFCFATFTVYNRETAEVNRIVLLLITELAAALGLMAFYVLRVKRRHSKMLGAANLKYEAIIGNICGGVEVTTLAKTFDKVNIVYVSVGFTKMTGYTYDDIMSLWGGKVYHYVYEKDREIINGVLKTIVNGVKEYDMEYRIICKDGNIVWVMDRGKVIENEEGVRQCQSVLTDISVIKEQRDMLAISEERFRMAIESSDNIMFDYDSVNCSYVDIANAERMLGKTKEQINSDLEYIRKLGEMERTAEITKYFYHPDDFDNVTEQSIAGFETGDVYFEARVRTGKGEYIWCRVHLTVISDENGYPYRILGFMGNIDAVKRQAELFRVRSEKDALTGFYNKAATISLVNDAFDNDVDTPHTLFVMDIDNFKTINDTMGHIAGDAVIAEVAERVRAIFRSDDILGRVGGDEFIVLIRGVSDVDHIIRKAAEITEAFNTMSVNAGGFFNVSVSIGIEVCTGHSNYEETFIKADKALYQAKRAGKNCYVFYDKAFSDSSCYTCNNMGGAQG